MCVCVCAGGGGGGVAHSFLSNAEGINKQDVGCLTTEF